MIPLSPTFLAYLRADGIVLPPDPVLTPSSNSGYDDDPYSEDDSPDPSSEWPSVHKAVQDKIRELGGHVYPKLNWSAPKDATWIAANNSMECTSANDIYLLLKSSDFITHDLEQAFSDCSTPDTTHTPEVDTEPPIPYHLVLRKSVSQWMPSMEFRCFVRRRRLLAVCQRDLNHYDFLGPLAPTLQDLLYESITANLKSTFPHETFVFDVYVPKPVPGGRIWLVDINPWAPRTDPLLFSWFELLTKPELPDERGADETLENGFLRLSLQNSRPQEPGYEMPNPSNLATNETHQTDTSSDQGCSDSESQSESDEDAEPLPYLPEIRLVLRDDPETYSFNTPLYSAHKLPKDVVDAGLAGEGGMRDFLKRWERRREDPAYESDSEEEG